MITRVVCISDTHNNYPALPDGDILIHCGDLTARGTFNELFSALGWLQRQPHKHKILVPGNHDEGLASAYIPNSLEGINFLVDREIEVEGLRIYGSPWLSFKGWSFHREDAELEKLYTKVPSGLDILVTHSPPLGILDSCRDGHVGLAALAVAVTRAKPKNHIFGHVHEAYGTMCGEETRFINCAWVGLTPDGKAKRPNLPFVLEIFR